MARLKLQHGSKIPNPPRKKSKVIRSRSSVPQTKGGVFLPDKEQLVRMIAMRGGTDDEIAEQFGVPYETFAAWRKMYPGFNKALEEGRMVVDADVTVSLYKQTQGYEYEEEAATPKGGIVTVKKYARPDFSAIKFWLTNRRPDLWKSSETHRLTGKDDDSPIGVKVETRNELIDAIVGMITPKTDGESRPKKIDNR